MVIAWAEQQRTHLSSGASKVLEELARFVRDDTWSCWPNIHTLATGSEDAGTRGTGQTEGQVRRHLVYLERKGFLARQPRYREGSKGRGRPTSALYILSVFGTYGTSLPMPDGLTLRPPKPLAMWPNWYQCPDCGARRGGS